MKTFGDLFDSVRSYLQERLTNPLFGAFIVSWVILNFRLMLVFLGDGSWREKITYIDSRLYSHWYDWAIYGYACPAIAALVYVFASPFISRKVTVYLREADKITVQELLEIEGETPLPRHEAEQLRKGLLGERQARIDLQQESSEKQAELTRQIDLLMAENKSLKDAKVGRSSPTSDDETLIDSSVQVTSSEEREHFKLDERDFVGVASQTVDMLVDRGLSNTQAHGLYAIRSGETEDENGISHALKLSDPHSVNVLIAQLLGLKLIETRHTDYGQAYQITSAGTQALEAALKRGFKP